MKEQAWAAVALLFTEHPLLGEAVLLIERAQDPRDPWSGHLSFPGGKLEAGECALHAALRECEEEIGLQIQIQNCIGELPLGYAGKAQGLSKAVKPYLFRLHGIPNLTLQGSEVAAVHWLSLSDFRDPQRHLLRRNLAPQHPESEFPCFELGEKVLWGFSYACLVQALQLQFKCE